MWFRPGSPVALVADLLPTIPAEVATPTTRTHIPLEKDTPRANGAGRVPFAFRSHNTQPSMIVGI